MKTLGKQAVDAGCDTYIGYKDEFQFFGLPKFVSRPLKDPLAGPVMESSNAIAESLFKGHTVRESIEASQARTAHHILKLLGSREPFAGKVIRQLYRNMNSLAFHGKETIKL